MHIPLALGASLSVFVYVSPSLSLSVLSFLCLPLSFSLCPVPYYLVLSTPPICSLSSSDCRSIRIGLSFLNTSFSSWVFSFSVPAFPLSVLFCDTWFLLLLLIVLLVYLSGCNAVIFLSSDSFSLGLAVLVISHRFVSDIKAQPFRLRAKDNVCTAMQISRNVVYDLEPCAAAAHNL